MALGGGVAGRQTLSRTYALRTLGVWGLALAFLGENVGRPKGGLCGAFGALFVKKNLKNRLFCIKTIDFKGFFTLFLSKIA